MLKKAVPADSASPGALPPLSPKGVPPLSPTRAGTGKSLASQQLTTTPHQHPHTSTSSGTAAVPVRFKTLHKVTQADVHHAKALVAAPPEGEKLEFSDELWAELLTPFAFTALRRKQYERPFSGEYVNFQPADKHGVFQCAACKLPLYVSYEFMGASLGYPAFRSAIPGTIEKRFGADGLDIAYHCIRCEAYVGQTQMTGFNFSETGGVSGEIKVSSYSIVFAPMESQQIALLLKEFSSKDDALARRNSGGLGGLLRRRSSNGGSDMTPSGQSSRQLNRSLSKTLLKPGGK